jgi:hypothetical protein
MKVIKIKGKREPITIAEWSDIKHLVEEDLKKQTQIYS